METAKIRQFDVLRYNKTKGVEIRQPDQAVSNFTDQRQSANKTN